MRSRLKVWGMALLLAGQAGAQPAAEPAAQPNVATHAAPDAAPDAAPHAAPDAAPHAAPGAAPPNRAAIQAAVADLRRDPNLGRDRTVKSLRWVSHKADTPEPSQPPNWIVGLFEFLSQAAGLVLWVALGLGLAFAAVWVYRVIQARRPPPRVAVPEDVSQVQDLDIRPASLPADVGAAALALLAGGRTRDALSLLYRGALSRAVHNFSVPITPSYTEGEALRAVNQRMDPSRARYFAALVGLWQRAVYAEETPPTEAVAALCREFSPALGVTPI